MDRSLVSALALASCALLVAACGGSPPPPAQAGDVAPPPPATPVVRKEVESPTTSNVSISDEIREKCGIPDADAYFQFDSAHVTSHDHTPLDLVVRCFTSGPLAGRSIKLVGRADPRGESEYNITLGQSRADAVAGYLDSRGMNKGKTLTSSRGAMDATGTDEGGWQHDRRVDVMVGD